MSQTNLRIFVAVLLVALFVGFTAAAHADNELSKKDKKWLEEKVGAIVTAQEIKIYKDIDKKDRKLFKKIFWARRDPNPATEKSEFEKEFETKVKLANKQFKAKGVKGSATDMGKIFCLLGNPTRTEGGAQAATWIYDPNPKLGVPDGLTIQFKGNQMVTSEELENALERAKTRLISNPIAMYARDTEGWLLEPRANIDPNSPASLTLTALRETQATSSDVPFDTTIAFFRASEGAIYIPMLFEVDDAPLTWNNDTTDLTVFGAVENTEGFTIYQFQEPASVKKTAGGRTMYDIPMQLVPGQYKLYVGVRDNASATAGTQIMDLEVPDYFGSELVMSSVVVYNEGKEVSDPAGIPGHAFQFGAVKFQLASTFTKDDAIGIFFFLYGMGVDENGKPNITGRYAFYRDGERKGQTAEQPLQGNATQAVGNVEIPLNIPNFDKPGKWKMRVMVKDHILNKTLNHDFEFVLEGESETQ